MSLVFWNAAQISCSTAHKDDNLEIWYRIDEKLIGFDHERRNKKGSKVDKSREFIPEKRSAMQRRPECRWIINMHDSYIYLLKDAIQLSRHSLSACE